MKIAKRALAIIMAVALVGCMSAMAFAAGSVSLYYDGDKNITVTANGMIGLKSFDFTITADDGVVIKNVKKSGDASQCETLGNSFTTEFNKANGKFSGYFKENLWDTDTWNAAADDLGEDAITFNPSSFNMGTIVIDASAAAPGAKVYISGSVKGTDASVDTSVQVKEGSTPTEKPTEAPTQAPTDKPTQAPTQKPTEKPTQAPTAKPTAKPTEKPTQAPTAKPTEKPTQAPVTKPTEAPTKGEDSKPTQAPTQAPGTTAKPVNPNTGNDVPTGDNMALAAAAGIVALAGAAFVISKKRK